VDDPALNDALDQVWSREQQVAVELALKLQEHAAWKALEHELVLAALALGKEAVVDSLPFLQVALKTAILAA
jgi:hypothetical protein